jgi:hypothetical protein
MSSTRPLTQNEASLVPFALQNLQLDVENNYYFGLLGPSSLLCTSPRRTLD